MPDRIILASGGALLLALGFATCSGVRSGGSPRAISATPTAIAGAPGLQLSGIAPVEIEAGARLRVRLNQSGGGRFHGTLVHPILVDGQIAIPVGATVTGSVLNQTWTPRHVQYGGQSYRLNCNAAKAKPSAGQPGNLAASDAVTSGVNQPPATVLTFTLAAPLQVVPPSVPRPAAFVRPP